MPYQTCRASSDVATRQSTVLLCHVIAETGRTSAQQIAAGGVTRVMNRTIRGAVLAGLAGSFLFAACEPAPPAGEAEAYLRETTAFCAEVGAYASAYEDWDRAGKAWPEWHASASSLVEALDEWELKRPDELPADVASSIDRYLDSFVARLRGLENVQALRADCGDIAAGLEQYVATLR